MSSGNQTKDQKIVSDGLSKSQSPLKQRTSPNKSFNKCDFIKDEPNSGKGS